LFIAVDDLNDFPTFTGRYPDAKTPHMDRLVERGVVFTRAHCLFPLCGASRASVIYR
jgi:arylsulfatase A-like enzyme